MATARWQHFFKDAGIPGGPAGNYAIIFSDNRMRMDMLNELNKEILGDLGISVMGDVIAILRHSKKVYAEISRSAAEEFDVNRTKTHDEKEVNRPRSDAKPKPTTPNSAPSEQKRLLAKKEPMQSSKDRHERATEAVDMITNTKAKKSMKSLSSRFSEYSATPAKKWKEERDEIITISVPVSASGALKAHKNPVKEKQSTQKDVDKKKSVFDRLGSSTSDAEDSPASHTVQKPDTSIKETKISNVFKRLGEGTQSNNFSSEQRTLSSKFSSLPKKAASSEPIITVTVGKHDPARLGQAGSQSVLRPVKHVKPLPRKPLAMDIEPSVQKKPTKGNMNSGSKLKLIKKPESRTVSKSVFDRLGK